ncbi:M48 family metallopeptidase [Caenimonas terrae]|uniref:M48 family metallopeptidase n=1 Tax=Caenimonas terrae TaxID=696074 RepID=A0ABW0N980_9BURK
MTDSIAAAAGFWRALALGLALVALPASGAFAKAQPAEGVAVGKASRLSALVPAAEVENAAAQQYRDLLAQAADKRALAQPDHPQLQRIRAVATRLIAQAPQWNPRAAQWKWEVNLIGSNQVNAFCMPGGKIVFFSGILDQLKLTDDEVAMVMGHEMAHALREHARERMAKGELTNVGANVLVQVLGLGQVGQAMTGIGAQLMTLKFSRSDESEADLVGMEIAARAGYDPRAAITLWTKMSQASKGSPPQWISTHPSSATRIAELQRNLPRVMPLYERAKH